MTGGRGLAVIGLAVAGVRVAGLEDVRPAQRPLRRPGVPGSGRSTPVSLFPDQPR
ncbi:hypothetical protein [Saccharothrix sp. HUAS TT1]|uniref:hypothetical protein n=1 Tax=unclassified Saccharothrix TaxID=2593673 RepID=UPI00345B8C9A